MSGNQAILIIGVGRSGTSALARVLSLCGCNLPKSVLGATVAGKEINQKGCWEPIDIWKLNKTFLFQHGTLYADPTMRLQELTINDHEKEGYIEQVQLFLHHSAGGLLVIKEPDITELMDLWLEAARREQFSVKVVIPIRHPEEVFKSLATLGLEISTSRELAHAFWLKRNLLAERCSRDLPRVFIEYSNLLKDWRQEIMRVSNALNVELKPDETAVDSFLAADLYRNRSVSIFETFSYSWLTRTYSALSAAARDTALDMATLDEIYCAYRANERAFRIAWDEFRDKFNRIDPKQYSETLESAPVWSRDTDF